MKRYVRLFEQFDPDTTFWLVSMYEDPYAIYIDEVEAYQKVEELNGELGAGDEYEATFGAIDVEIMKLSELIDRLKDYEKDEDDIDAMCTHGDVPDSLRSAISNELARSLKSKKLFGI